MSDFVFEEIITHPAWPHQTGDCLHFAFLTVKLHTYEAIDRIRFVSMRAQAWQRTPGWAKGEHWLSYCWGNIYDTLKWIVKTSVQYIMSWMGLVLARTCELRVDAILRIATEKHQWFLQRIKNRNDWKTRVEIIAWVEVSRVWFFDSEVSTAGPPLHIL